MIEASITDIRKRAHIYYQANEVWHFHILTPTCSLNTSSQYAFILECLSREESYVHFSDRAEKSTGEELLPLLHGTKVFEPDTTVQDYQPSDAVQAMIDRAQHCNARNLVWHHHMLFPGCRFNPHSEKFILLFEDVSSDSVLESVTNSEPTDDLKQIETLFYEGKS